MSIRVHSWTNFFSSDLRGPGEYASYLRNATAYGVSPRLRADGLVFVGLDIIGERLTGAINAETDRAWRDGHDIASSFPLVNINSFARG